MTAQGAPRNLYDSVPRLYYDGDKVMLYPLCELGFSTLLLYNQLQQEPCGLSWTVSLAVNSWTWVDQLWLKIGFLTQQLPRQGITVNKKQRTASTCFTS